VFVGSNANDKFLDASSICAGITRQLSGAATSLPPVLTLPPPQFRALVLGGGFDTVTTDGAPLSVSGGGNTLTAITDTSVPKVSAYVDGPNFLITDASLVYSFEIVGIGTTVDVGIGSNGGISQSAGAGNGDVQLLLDDNQIAFANIASSEGQYIGSGPPCVFGGACTRTYSLDGTFDLTVGVVHTITMSANVGNGPQDSVPQSMSAYIDPMITVPQGYTLLRSEGVGNSLTPSVPEPSTWTMFLLGFASLGFAGRRMAKGAREIRSA
jgi:hypothetical protein